MNALPLKICIAVLLLHKTAIAGGAIPQIDSLSVYGLQLGTENTIVIQGANLSNNPRLILPFSVEKQSLGSVVSESEVHFSVVLASDISPSIYPLRVATDNGLSNAHFIGVDDLPQRQFADRVESLPVALTGRLVGKEIARTQFNGKKGEEVVLEVESRRIGGRLEPVLRVMDARGVQMAWSAPKASLSGDTRLKLSVPSDGEYHVELHDNLYRGEKPGHFRLKLGKIHYADAVFPLAVKRGTSTTLQFIGTNLSAETYLRVAADELAHNLPAKWPPIKHLSGSPPSVLVSDLDELVELQGLPEASHFLPSPPIATNGVLNTGEVEDRFIINVKSGERLNIDLLASRVGSSLDGVISVRDPEGKSLAESDDRPGTKDPGLEFTVPDSINQIHISVRDLQERGGDDFVYRLSVTPAEKPHLTLLHGTDLINIPNGGTSLLRVDAVRQGFEDPIQLDFPGLSEGVRVDGNVIPAGASFGLVTFSTNDEIEPARLTITGEAAPPQGAVHAVSRLPEQAVSERLPWLREEIILAVSAPSPIGVTWASGPPSTLYRGGRQKVKIGLTRKEEAEGKLRLSLLTDQAVPKKKEQQPGQPETEADDTDKAIRLEGNALVEEGVSEFMATIVVPPDLPVRNYSLAARAELLAENEKDVIASAVTPVTVVPVKETLELQLASQGGTVKAITGVGAAGTIQGTVVRHGNDSFPVVVRLTNLPDGYGTPEVTVNAHADSFFLPVRFPYEVAEAEIAEARLVASAMLDANGSQINVESAAVPVKLKVEKGAPPPAFQPLELFDDRSDLLPNLVYGNGEAMLTSLERYSGNACLKIVSGEAKNAVFRGLNAAIREKPAAGEYRFLRFAWKKQDGDAVWLQLANAGQWGSATEAAKSFRYRAGQETGGLASLEVSDATPREWQVVTRDLFADFGEFNLTGLGFQAGNGSALFDHLYLARAEDDFNQLPVSEQ